MLLGNVHIVSMEIIVSTAKQTQKIKRDKTDLFLRLRRCFSVNVLRNSSKARYKSAHLVVGTPWLPKGISYAEGLGECARIVAGKTS